MFTKQLLGFPQRNCPESLTLTDTRRSPFLSSPQRSAGPPARMKEMKMPSPSSPPTMLKPSPVVPRCRTTLRGSLLEQEHSVNVKASVAATIQISTNASKKGAALPRDVVISQHALGRRRVASGCGCRREGLRQEVGGADMIFQVLSER